jgi:ATP-dependent DNA helicase
MYHGTPEERAELRRTVMASPRKHEKLPPLPSRTKKRRLSRRHRDFDSDEDSVIEVESEDGDGAIKTDPEDNDVNPTTQLSSFPVVITTYEMIIKDRVHLAKYDWGQVIVDEGHRLKNMDSILMQEIKKYPSAGRMLLTGTPLHVSVVQQCSCCMRSHGVRRTTWQSFGPSLILSCQKSLTMWPPSKNRRPFSYILPIFPQLCCSQV